MVDTSASPDGDHDKPIPYRGFGSPASSETKSDETFCSPTQLRSTALAYSSPKPAVPPRRAIGSRLLSWLDPRKSDIQQLMIKLSAQFEGIGDVTKYDKDDPKHPLNNPNLIREIHFVGRSATDTSIVDLSSFLTNNDTFGAITELWLNNNLISDEGASSIASFLQLPYCALVELWLGQNNIGPVGTALLSAALSSNEGSQLKCLGLYKNPIENGGAGCLAQMLRGNHKLSTVDIHGCMYDGKKSGGDEEMEGYGCKVVKTNDGKEYIARIDMSSQEEKLGYVTDQRLLDAITTFSAFNRINPTREQAIRGLVFRTRKVKPPPPPKATPNGNNDGSGSSDSDNTTKNDCNSEKEHETTVSKFLSDLCTRPSTERLTVEEKRKWKDCEWDRLYVEIERARFAMSALASRLEIKEDDSLYRIGEEDSDEEKDMNTGEDHLHPVEGIVQAEERVCQ